MNKTEMAEWLAENVLGLEEQIDRLAEKNSSQKMYVLRNRYFRGEHRNSKMEAIKRFIYSPDGFFAVLDSLFEKYGAVSIYRKSKVMSLHGCEIGFAERNFRGEGKDRYEAFYNAVYEAMNENDDH